MSGVTREAPTRAAVEFIVHNLRDRDRREILALRWDDNLDPLIDQILAVCANSDLWSAWWWDGVPVALNGANMARPGVFVLGAFGTDEWPWIVRALTRDAFDRVLPGMIERGGHRAEAYALAENTDSRRWIEALGGEQEGLLREYGRTGEDFILYAWRLRDVLRRRRQKQFTPPILPDIVGGHVLRGTGDRPDLPGQGGEDGGAGPDDGPAGHVRQATGPAEADRGPAGQLQPPATGGPESPAGRAPGAG
jgi:hypothetical protein